MSANDHEPRIVLSGMGHWFPETVLDNQFFDQLGIGSSAEWIDERVGIKERRSVLARGDIQALKEGRITRPELVAQGRIMTMAAMAKAPWAMALARARGSERGLRIDLTIAGTSVPDWDIPANACAIAASLSLGGAAFDVNSACSSFVVNLHVARSLLLSRNSKACAIFNAERYTTRLDYRDRASCVLFGDGAAAAILETAPDATGLELLDTIVHSDPAGFEHVRIPDGGHFAQNGKAVQKFAVTKTVDVTLEILERNGLTLDDIGYFIGHQANFRMLTSACERNGIDAARHLFNVDICGNQGAAGAPCVLSQGWDNVRPGQYVVVSVVGSGLTWGAALFRK